VVWGRDRVRGVGEEEELESAGVNSDGEEAAIAEHLYYE